MRLLLCDVLVCVLLASVFTSYVQSGVLKLAFLKASYTQKVLSSPSSIYFLSNIIILRFVRLIQK